MAGIVFDSSVYIDAFRRKDAALLSARRARRSGEKETRPLWLSAVVLEELLVGAVNPAARQLCLKLEKDFTRVNRLIVPSRSDWIAGGQILCAVGQKYGFAKVAKSKMTNDALIAMSAASKGFTVLTKNGKDFARLAEFRPFNWEEV